MSFRGAFFASISLVFVIAWIGEASAQSSLPPCPPIGYLDGCIGTYTWRDGRKYVGEFRAGKLNGQGSLTYADGSKYVGEWRDGQRSGRGTDTWPDGRKYVGGWRDGKANGQGTLTQSDGGKYVGEFQADKRNGQGTMTFSDGSKYVGHFSDDTFSGQGTYTWRDGEEYVGEWRDGEENGQGTRTLSSGAKYIGAWQAGKQHGQGKEYSSDGELALEGYWISGAYYGPKAPDSLRVENGDRVKMVESGGIYHVPVLINDALKLNFIVDSGASDVSIPSDVVLTLIRTGTIKSSDFIGTAKYGLADGSTVESGTFIIRSLKVGDRTVTDVRASIADVNGPLLLGQSFLKRFKSWSLDNATHELILQPDAAQAPGPAPQAPPTTTLSQFELDAMRARLASLWDVHPGVEHPEELFVTVRIRLGRDRRLVAPPQVVSSGSSPRYQAAADAAVRAVLQGQPYEMLRDETYGQWKYMDIDFDPKKLFRTN